MKIIKLNPKAKQTIKTAVVASFLYRDVDIFRNTRLQFLKNNPKIFNLSSGLIA